MILQRTALLVALVTTCAATPASADKAYVVASDQPAFAEAARAALDALGGDAELLRADDSAKTTLGTAQVIVAVGPLADRLVSASAGKDARVIECLTPKATAARNVSVPLRPSEAEVFSLVHELLGSTVQKIAVFPAPGASESELATNAREAGFELLLPKKDEMFAAALDRLVESADAVWIEDTNAVPSGGTALIVKKASDGRKPVIGPNRATVLQGAFFAVVPDPAAHGRAAGEAAARLLKGDDVRAVPAPSGHIVLNGSLARSLHTHLSATLQRRAETVE